MLPTSVKAGLRRAIRIWVPGCATGEEVYSVAIAVLEYFGDGLPPLKIQIFGTDVSEAALEKARAGVCRQCTKCRLNASERFFVGQNGECGFRRTFAISASSRVRT